MLYVVYYWNKHEISGVFEGFPSFSCTSKSFVGNMVEQMYINQQDKQNSCD